MADNRFEDARKIYNDPSSSEYMKKLAKKDMDRMVKSSQKYNRVHNPKKYAEDKAKQAEKDAKFWKDKAKEY